MRNHARSRPERLRQGHPLLTTSPPAPLVAARRLAAAGDDEAAKQAYLALLRREPTNVPALIELAAIAQTTGHQSAARTAYQQAATLDPTNPIAQTGLATILRDLDELLTAQAHYRAALAADPAFPPAHQGLGQLLAAIGHPQADHHLAAGFRGHALQSLRYRGTTPGISILLLLAARGGNVPTAQWIDDRRYAVTALIADFHDPGHPLPPHALIVNAIGDADLCPAALTAADSLVATSSAPIINPPARVIGTGRRDIARRLAGLPGVITPTIDLISRDALTAKPNQTFPLLLRSPGYHTGQNFLRIDTPESLATAILPGDEFWAIQYLDAAAPDGLFRKYRVMFIDGALYPLHMAASTNWKVHYFTGAMADRPDLRDEEARFLTDMPATLGPRAMSALAAIQSRLALDYAGIDFALSPDGSLILFEANATMVINPPGPDPIWNYRRPAITNALSAAATMIHHRIEPPP